MRTTRAAAAIAIAIAAAGLAAAGATAQTDPAGPLAIGGGRHLYAECAGSGRPTVMLEAGLRSRGDYWSVEESANQRRVVFDAVAERTRVCLYDRPGTTLGVDEFSRSDPVPQPRTAADAAADLRALIRSAPIRGQLILAGHSTGGLIQRLYASTHPRRIVGMVQVDALAEAIEPAMGSDWAQFQQLNIDPPPGLEEYADLETIPFGRSFAQMRRVKRRSPLRPIPLVVISRGIPQRYSGLPAGFAANAEHAWSVGQRQLGRLVPGATRWTAEHSGHYVMFDQPAIVIRAIGRVLRATRR